MSILDEFMALLKEAGAEFSAVQKDVRSITYDALLEAAHDPLRYIQDSAADLALMGIRHPLLEKFQYSQQSIVKSKSHIQPIEGSILYTDLLNNYAHHSGVYIGNNKIVELNRHGQIQVVSPEKFMSAGTGTEIYVSCANNKAIGAQAVAKRARSQIGLKRKYNVLSNNCHQFSSGCLSGDFENDDNFLWMLKTSAFKHLGANNWRIAKSHF